MAAIYQWFKTGRFIDFEYVLYATNEGWNTYYLGMDYETNTATEFGAVRLDGNASVISDGKTFITSKGYELKQFIWRGQVGSLVLDSAADGNNPPSLIIAPSAEPEFQFLLAPSTQSFSQNMTKVPFNRDAPFTFSPQFEYTTIGGGYHKLRGGGTIKQNNPNVPGYGDALFLYPEANGRTMFTFSSSGGAITIEDSIIAPFSVQNRWGWDPYTGICVCAYGSAFTPVEKALYFYAINPTTLEITYIGGGGNATVDHIKAVGVSPSGHIITVEVAVNGSTQPLILRSYSRVGSTLTLEDTVNLTGGSNNNIQIRTSPLSGRIWVLGAAAHADPNQSCGTWVFTVADDGTLVQNFHLAHYSMGNSGYVGNPIAFLQNPLEVTPNGFEGVKAKLFDCYEMEEASGNRNSSLGLAPTLVPTAPVSNRVGKVGNAANFSGAGEGLQAALGSLPIEMTGISNFSICADVLLDSKSADQVFLARGNGAGGTTGLNQDFFFMYEQSTDRLLFGVNRAFPYLSGTVIYKAYAHDLGSPNIGTNYHVYMEFNKTDFSISIRVNGGALNTTLLPLGANIKLTAQIVITFNVGHQYSSGDIRPVDGYVDQLFLFWDVLDSDEQDFMYNSGNSRAFAEL